jgi:RNase adapter protein RapZ
MDFKTFGLKHRVRPDDGAPDLWVDCRKFPNPHHQYRNKTGLDAEVAAWLTEKIHGDAALKRMYDAIVSMVENTRANCGPQAKIVFYCVGGRHRSVYISERVAKELRSEHELITVTHMELQ